MKKEVIKLEKWNISTSDKQESIIEIFSIYFYKYYLPDFPAPSFPSKTSLEIGGELKPPLCLLDDILIFLRVY